MWLMVPVVFQDMILVADDAGHVSVYDPCG